MPLIISNYLFCTKILDTLDKNYDIKLREKLDMNFNFNSSSKIFTYSNLETILSLYPKKNNYNISKNFNESISNIISKATDYIRKNNYNMENIIFIISILTSKILFNHLEDYFKFMENYDTDIFIRDLDYIYALKNNIKPNKPNLATQFDKSFLLNLCDYDFIKFLLNDCLKFPLGDKYLEACLKEFNNILLNKNLNKLFYKNNNDYNLFQYTDNTIVSKTFIESPIYNEKSYLDLINEAFNEAYKTASSFLDALIHQKKLNI